MLTEFEKQIDLSNLLMKMQAEMLTVMADALCVIKVGDQIDVRIIAAEALEEYKKILARYQKEIADRGLRS